mgnify:CR=1 FL=1
MYLPEKFHPSQFLKGHEFLSISLQLLGMRYSLDKTIRFATQLDLDPTYLRKKISSYSKGMGQKLGLVLMLMSEAPLFILDEPMSGLDPSARIALKKQLINLRSNGHTVFFSSHILADIEEICDRIAIINNGSIVFTGTPEGFKSSLCKHKSLEEAFVALIKGEEAI